MLSDSVIDATVSALGTGKVKVVSHLIRGNTGSPRGKLYKLNCDVLKTPSAIANQAKSQNKIDLWHQRLAHVNEKQ